MARQGKGYSQEGVGFKSLTPDANCNLILLGTQGSSKDTNLRIAPPEQ